MTHFEPYIVVFWDKSKVQISFQTGEKLKMGITSGQIKTFELGNSLYSVAGVEKIIPKDEAYNIFPTETEYLSTLENRETEDQALKVLPIPNLEPDLAGQKRLNEMKNKTAISKTI